jgi:hypothetical protein
VPTFRTSCTTSASTFHEFRKVMAPEKQLFQCRFPFEVPARNRPLAVTGTSDGRHWHTEVACSPQQGASKAGPYENVVEVPHMAVQQSVYRQRAFVIRTSNQSRTKPMSCRCPFNSDLRKMKAAQFLRTSQSRDSSARVFHRAKLARLPGSYGRHRQLSISAIGTFKISSCPGSDIRIRIAAGSFTDVGAKGDTSSIYALNIRFWHCPETRHSLFENPRRC